MNTMNIRRLQTLVVFCLGTIIGSMAIYYHSHYSGHSPAPDSAVERFDEASVHSPRTSEDRGVGISLLHFYDLPLRRRTTHFNIGRIAPSAQQIDTRQDGDGLLRAGIHFADDNKIVIDKPFGHFVLDTSGLVVGLRLLPSSATEAEDPQLGYVREGDDIIRFDSTRVMHYPWIDAPIRNSGHEYALRDLKSLRPLGKLAFLDFGVSRFEVEFWTSFREASAAVDLQGLVVRNGGDFLRRREGRSVPSITGLVISVDNMDDILACGEAFPNLRFLYLQVPHSVIESFGHGMPSAFPNLEALMVTMNPSISLENWLTNVAGQPAVEWLPNMFPRKLRWLCFDGSLMSVEGMRAFDFLGVRYEGPQARGRAPIECVFIGLGYSRERARFLGKDEYSTLEAHWLR